MQIEQFRWREGTGWSPGPPGNLAQQAQLVLIFGGAPQFGLAACFEEMRRSYPRALLLGCSTAGEICGSQVFENSLVVTAIHFEHTTLQAHSENLKGAADSYRVGLALGQAMKKKGLVHAFVISEGLRVNGSELVKGLEKGLPKGVTVTGGLSADGDRFEKTLVGWNGPPEPHRVGILGLYGKLRVGYGSLGGWDAFGPERLITKSEGNVLFELDGKLALQLYKLYLGEEHARELPAAGLLFPLAIRGEGFEKPLVRTILAVDEANQSMTFAGDVPQGAYARLMKANFNRLLDGAAGAARVALQPLSVPPDLAILVSCVGRKLVLKQIVDEEIEAVREILGADAVFAGFYSYGEISPFTAGANCELHNQTMTVTTFSER